MFVGVDLGGTKIEAVLVSDDGAGGLVTHRRERVLTLAAEGYEAIVARTVGLVRDIVAAERLAALPPVGIGLPGGVSRRTGLVKNANTVCLNGRPFRADVSAALGREVAFENDANCLALAETVLGAGREHRAGVVFAVILGTGVGGGWTFGGSLHGGVNGIAGEWGHHTLREGGRACYCGRRGCVETYLAGPALAASYRERTGEQIAGEEVVARADTGEPAASAVFGAYLEDFGRALGNVVNVVDPDAIVLGGGLSRLDALYDRGREALARHTFNDELRTPLLRASLGDSAGVFGAALLARAALSSGKP